MFQNAICQFQDPSQILAPQPYLLAVLDQIGVDGFHNAMCHIPIVSERQTGTIKQALDQINLEGIVGGFAQAQAVTCE